MFENIGSFFKKIMKPEQKELLVEPASKDAAKERLHIVLMQDRANVSADFLELMKQEIIDVIKKYIVIDEEQIDVRLTNQENDDGTTGAPALYANIPIINIRNDVKGEYLNQGNKEKTKSDYDTTLNSTNVYENNTVIDKEPNIENNINLQNINESEKLEDSKESDDSNFNKEKQDDYEENDDDVTFDDLLKVAEEEEKLKQIQNGVKVEKKEEKENENIDENKINNESSKEKPLPKSIKMSNKTAKKSTKKTTKKKNNKSNRK